MWGSPHWVHRFKADWVIGKVSNPHLKTLLPEITCGMTFKDFGQEFPYLSIKVLNRFHLKISTKKSQIPYILPIRDTYLWLISKFLISKYHDPHPPPILPNPAGHLGVIWTPKPNPQKSFRSSKFPWHCIRISCLISIVNKWLWL